MEHAMTVRAHDREIAEPRRSHAGLLGKWDGVVAFDVSGTVPPIDGPGPRQSRDSSRLSDDPTSWSGTTRLRWSRPGARFKRQAWSDIWCRPRLCRGPDQPPRYARSIVAMSIFFICSMACMARWDLSGSGSLIISFMGVGMICQDIPYLSFSQPQTPSSPPSLSRCQ